MPKRIVEARVRNYKSIANAVVSLGSFTALVGPNGSGKSNFVDSLAFVQECLSESIEVAFRNRGGIGAVRRRSTGHPTHISMGLALDLGEGLSADYGFEIAAKPTEKFRIAREWCLLKRPMRPDLEFRVADGVFEKAIQGIRPKVQTDRLALFAASATEEFRPVYDFLTSMRFYSVVPTRLRELQEPDSGSVLKRDGSNAAAVLKQLAAQGDGHGRYDRLCSLLSKVVEGLKRVEYRALGQKETLQFKQDVVGSEHPWTFDALNMSDGTLRVLGLLLAVYQPGDASVLTVEEPEATVHPAVMEVLLDVLLDASRERQVVITTHSPDILDAKSLGDDNIRVVALDKGQTLICPLAETTRKAVRDRLYTPGELLRVGELNPDLDAARRQNGRQPSLLDEPSSGDETP